MFGHAYFGASYFGPSYFGPAAGGIGAIFHPVEEQDDATSWWRRRTAPRYRVEYADERAPAVTQSIERVRELVRAQPAAPVVHVEVGAASKPASSVRLAGATLARAFAEDDPLPSASDIMDAIRMAFMEDEDDVIAILLLLAT